MEKKMLSHYAGCRFARLAGDPKKIVISDGNEFKKPGDLVATVTDDELAEELVYLWNEGIKQISIEQPKIEIEEEEAKKTTPDIEAFIDDIRDTLHGPEGNPTKDTLELVFQMVDKEIMKTFIEERNEIFNQSANGNRMVDPHKAIEMMERHRNEALQEVEGRTKATIIECIQQATYGNLPLVRLMAGVFKEEVALVEELLNKCGPGDQHIKRFLAHVRNRIITGKDRSDG